MDSPKANTTFKTKQRLPYELLCNPSGSLVKSIGMSKSPKGTKRGVFVVSKDGDILASQPGGPAATVEVVQDIVRKGGRVKAEDQKIADTAGEVADTARKLDANA